MTDLTLENPVATNSWVVDLSEYNEIENNLPMNFCNVNNSSSLALYVFLNGHKVGKVQAYSGDTYFGRTFSTFTIESIDGDLFAIKDIFVQVGSGVQNTANPYNPAWETIEEDLSKYASGCNNRISFSSLISADMIKFWINANNSLIVQRRLDIQGSAALGTYEIKMDAASYLTGSTPINGSVLDTKRYKDEIVDEGFDYTETNCSIKGLMVDLLLNSDEISDTYTLEAGGATGPNVYDKNLGVYAGVYNSPATDNTWLTGWEVSFASIDISKISYYMGYYGAFVNRGARVRLSVKDGGSWTVIYMSGDNDTTTETQVNNHIKTGWTACTGLKVEVGQTSGGGISCGRGKIYEISVIKA